MENIKVIDDWLETAQLICTKTDGKTKYEFNKFMLPLKFASKIYNRNLTLQKAIDDQQKLQTLINKRNNDYNPTSKIKIKEKDGTLKSAKKLFFIREEIINAFKKAIFPYIDGLQVKEEEIDEQMDTTIMSELESEESAAERRNQQGQGIKILTPSQMLSRLPISLAQLKAGNNSRKIKKRNKTAIIFSLPFKNYNQASIQ